MKKEQVLIGLGVATAMVTAFNGHAQADEVVNKHSTKSTVNQSETKKDADVSESDVKMCIRDSVLDVENRQFELVEKLADNVELPIQVTIASGFPKGDKLEFITQKVTELGASQIWSLSLIHI